jgi:hypothetical protein
VARIDEHLCDGLKTMILKMMTMMMITVIVAASNAIGNDNTLCCSMAYKMIRDRVMPKFAEELPQF